MKTQDRSEAADRMVLKRRLITVGVLLLAGGTALLAVPGLHDAAVEASSITPSWLL